MLGFILAGLSGLSLGLLGGGGSILTVPILVYVFNIDSKPAIAMSLAIVGLTTIVGVFGHYRENNIHFKMALLFGCASIPATFLGTNLSKLFSGESQLVIFAIVMVLAAISMSKKRKESSLQAKQTQKNQSIPIILSGILTGVLTGLIGVGGGFLIVPALSFFTRIDIKKAVGTSLLIISVNSFIGFASYATSLQLSWPLILKFTACSVIGILVGSKLVNYIPQQKLRKGFIVFLIVMAIFILYKNY